MVRWLGIMLCRLTLRLMWGRGRRLIRESSRLLFVLFWPWVTRRVRLLTVNGRCRYERLLGLRLILGSGILM